MHKYFLLMISFPSLMTGFHQVKYLYDYEVELNDNKRNINIINPDFIQDIDYEVKKTLLS